MSGLDFRAAPPVAPKRHTAEEEEAIARFLAEREITRVGRGASGLPDPTVPQTRAEVRARQGRIALRQHRARCAKEKRAAAERKAAREAKKAAAPVVAVTRDGLAELRAARPSPPAVAALSGRAAEGNLVPVPVARPATAAPEAPVAAVSTPARRSKGGRKPETPDHVLRALVAEGLTCAEIGARIGRSRQSVHHSLTRLGVEPRLERSRRPTREALAALVADGLSRGAMAARLGCGRSALREWPRAEGLATTERPPPPAPETKPVDRTRVEAMLARGEAIPQIAAAIGVSRSTLQRRLSEWRIGSRLGLPQALPALTEARARALAKAALLAAAVARALGRSDRTVEGHAMRAILETWEAER